MSAFKVFFVEKYTLFTFFFFKSKHDISLSIIKRQRDKTLEDLIQIKKKYFFSSFLSVCLSQQAKKKTSRVKNSIQGRKSLVLFAAVIWKVTQKSKLIRLPERV